MKNILASWVEYLGKFKIKLNLLEVWMVDCASHETRSPSVLGNNCSAMEKIGMCFHSRHPLCFVWMMYFCFYNISDNCGRFHIVHLILSCLQKRLCSNPMKFQCLQLSVLMDVSSLVLVISLTHWYVRMLASEKNCLKPEVPCTITQILK